MTFIGNTGAQLAVGLEGWAQKCRVVKRGGAGVVGDVVMFDMAQSDSAVTSNQAGKPEGGVASVIKPVDSNGELKFAQFAILLEAAADDGEALAQYGGRCKAYVIKASGNIAAGDPLGVDTNGNLTADTASGDKIVARAAEDVTAPASRTLADVLFDGIGLIGVA